MDPRSPSESTHTPMSDLDLLLAESDREDPFLIQSRDDATQDEDAIDDQILAGLVTP